MSRCIVVMGLPRSGTSLIAGILHRLGVDMGSGHLTRANRHNPLGYYEDARWQYLSRRLLGMGYWPKLHEDLLSDVVAGWQKLAEKCSASPLWGFKDVRTAFLLEDLLPHLPDPRIVEVRRDFAASMRSLQRHSQTAYKGKRAMDEAQARQALERWQTEMDGSLAYVRRRGVPVYEASYEEIVAGADLRPLWEFCVAGLTDVPEPDWASASAFVRADLNHAGSKA